MNICFQDLHTTYLVPKVSYLLHRYQYSSSIPVLRIVAALASTMIQYADTQESERSSIPVLRIVAALASTN